MMDKIDNPLWDYSLAAYRRAGVADLCLQLQDRWGADVNMLLAACWLASQGLHWGGSQVRQLQAGSDDWRRHCIEPARTLRRFLNTQGDEPLYEQAKALELAAECRHQAYLYCELLATDGGSHLARTGDAELLVPNLKTYCRELAVSDWSELDIVLAELAVAILMPL